MPEEYSQITEPTTAVRATLRDLLQHQIAALELAPKWLWEMEFGLHIWPLLERFHRDGSPEARELVGFLKRTASVTAAVLLIHQFLDEKDEATPPW